MLRPTEAFFLRSASVLVAVCALGVTLAPRPALAQAAPADGGAGAPAPEPATILGLGVSGAPGVVGQGLASRRTGEAQGAVPSQLPVSPQEPQALAPYEVRRLLLESRPFVATSIVNVPDAERTVFYDPQLLEGGGAQVILQPPEQVTAVPEGVVQVASWLVPTRNQTDRLGEVVGFAGEQVVRFGRTTVHLYDEIRMRFVVPGAPLAGDEFLTYRVTRSIEGVGDVLVPTGRVQVSHVDELGVVAVVVGEHDRMQIGDLVTRVRSFSLVPGIHPEPVASGPEARILAFQAQRELYMPGDFAFINLGSANGLRIGDELVGRGEDVMGGERFPVARFQVVSVGETVSTVRLRSVRAPGSLRPALSLVLDRMMP